MTSKFAAVLGTTLCTLLPVHHPAAHAALAAPGVLSGSPSARVGAPLLVGQVAGPGVESFVPLVRAPDLDEEDVYLAFANIYEGLFARPFDPETSLYLPDTPILQPGLYTGTSDGGQGFTLEVTAAGPAFDYLAVTDLDAQLRQWILTTDFTVVPVEGELATELGNVEVFGSVVSMLDPQEGELVAFYPHYYLSLLEASRAVTATDADRAKAGSRDAGEGAVLLAPDTEEEAGERDDPEGDECDQCYADYEAAVAAATAGLENALAAARADYENTVADSWEDLENCKTDSALLFVVCTAGVESIFAIAMAGCAATMFWAAPCVLASIAAQVVGMAACTAKLARTVKSCQRDQGLAQSRAFRNFERAVDFAETLYQEALGQAGQELEECLEENGCND